MKPDVWHTVQISQIPIFQLRCWTAFHSAVFFSAVIHFESSFIKGVGFLSLSWPIWAAHKVLSAAYLTSCLFPVIKRNSFGLVNASAFVYLLTAALKLRLQKIFDFKLRLIKPRPWSSPVPANQKCNTGALKSHTGVCAGVSAPGRHQVCYLLKEAFQRPGLSPWCAWEKLNEMRWSCEVKGSRMQEQKRKCDRDVAGIAAVHRVRNNTTQAGMQLWRNNNRTKCFIFFTPQQITIINCHTIIFNHL